MLLGKLLGDGVHGHFYPRGIAVGAGTQYEHRWQCGEQRIFARVTEVENAAEQNALRAAASMLEVDGSSITHTRLPWLGTCRGEERQKRNGRRTGGVGTANLMRLSAGEHEEVSRT